MSLGVLRCKHASRSRNGHEWHQSFDTVTGIVRCECEAWRYRGKCSHIAAMIKLCREHGLPAGGCIRCHNATAQMYQVADDLGEPVVGAWICSECVKGKR